MVCISCPYLARPKVGKYEIDNNKYADVTTVFLQSSSGQKRKEKEKEKQNNLKNENSEKMFADHYDR